METTNEIPACLAHHVERLAPLPDPLRSVVNDFLETIHPGVTDPYETWPQYPRKAVRAGASYRGERLVPNGEVVMEWMHVTGCCHFYSDDLVRCFTAAGIAAEMIEAEAHDFYPASVLPTEAIPTNRWGDPMGHCWTQVTHEGHTWGIDLTAVQLGLGGVVVQELIDGAWHATYELRCTPTPFEHDDWWAGCDMDDD